MKKQGDDGVLVTGSGLTNLMNAVLLNLKSTLMQLGVPSLVS